MAPASRTGSPRTFPRLGHHHAHSWCALRSRTFRHKPGIVTCLRLPCCSRAAWPLVPRRADVQPTGQQWLPSTGSTPDRSCSRGAPRPITPDTPWRHARSRSPDTRRPVSPMAHATGRGARGVPGPARPLRRPNPKHGQVRFDAPAGRRRDRSQDPSVSIPCTSAPQNERRVLHP
jgi:hypothetical protein